MVQQFMGESNTLPQNRLFPSMHRTDFAGFLRKTDKFINVHPDLLDQIKEDLDHHALEKKKVRKADQRWKRQQASTELPGCDIEAVEVDKQELTLKQGRPRTSEYVVFLLVMVRGYSKGTECQEFQDLVYESKSLEALLARRGETLPRPSTIWELLDAVTNSTREQIYQQQIDWITTQDLDDFDRMYADSTDVEANSEFPTDVSIIRKLIERIWRNGNKLEEFGLDNFQRGRTENRLTKIRRSEYLIHTNDHKSKKKKQYRRVYDFASKVADHLDEQREMFERTVEEKSIKPSEMKKLEEIRDQIRADLEKVRKVIKYSKKRVLEGGTTSSKKKELSISDPDAAFIKKGNRDPVIGYRPQIARSEKGFIGAFHLPEGNASDATQLVGMVERWEQKTGTTPGLVSTDDGYASKSNRERVEGMGVETVSFSGGTGKQIHGEETYRKEEYKEARRMRSSVESSVYVLKRGYQFGKVSRRGIESVRGELIEDVVAHNFFRMVQLDKEANEENKEDINEAA